MRGHVYKRGSSWTVVYDEQPDEAASAGSGARAGSPPGRKRSGS